jgi:hypothetical protein
VGAHGELVLCAHQQQMYVVKLKLSCISRLLLVHEHAAVARQFRLQAKDGGACFAEGVITCRWAQGFWFAEWERLTECFTRCSPLDVLFSQSCRYMRLSVLHQAAYGCR